MLEIRRLTRETAGVAGVLFEALRADEGRFHPHPLTAEHASTIASLDGDDVYMVAVGGRPPTAVAYGMLRGWDAGFETPTLGVAVHPGFRGVGLGRAMMAVLHCVAALRRAPGIRLKVYPSNTPAVRMYESLGYTWQPELELGQRVGVLRLRG